MPNQKELFFLRSQTYLDSLHACFSHDISDLIYGLSSSLADAWCNNQQVFICGNGGSAANAIHMANDFLYGVGSCGDPPQISGIKVEALPSNVGIVTCLANDTGYEHIYSKQLEVKSNPGDILIVLSGSGNSSNVVNALIAAKTLKLRSFAILAFNGGRCKELADCSIHLPIHDMQIAEDTQLIIGHLCMQWLNSHKSDHFQS